MRKLIGLAASLAGLAAFNLHAQTIAPVITSGLIEPYGVAVDLTNVYYVTDSANNRIAKYDPNQGVLVNLSGSPGNAGYSNGVGVFARFFSPQGIVFAQNTLIVADGGNHLIRVVGMDGTAGTIAGGPNAGSPTANAGFADGVGTAALFNAPAGLALDPNGTVVFVADLLNNAVRRVDLLTSNVTTVVSTGLLGPSAVAVDTAGQLYVADTRHHTIQVVNKTTGALITTYGQVGIAGLVNDLSAANARFDKPDGLLWVDVATGLLISDAGNHVIRRAYLNTTIPGSLITVETYANSQTNNLGTPVGLALDKNSNFPFADLGKNQVLVIQKTPPLPQVNPPQIGVVNITTNAFGGPDYVFTPISGAATFNNDALMTILSTDTNAVNTSYNYNTTNATLDISLLNRTAPAFQNHLGPQPAPSPNPSGLLAPASGQPTNGYLVQAYSFASGRRPSSITSAQATFVVANPVIVGDNFNSFFVQDGTTNATMYYTTDGSLPNPLSSLSATNGQNLSLPNFGSNITFNVQAIKGGYVSSLVVSKVFNLNAFQTTVIGLTNVSGRTNFTAGPGDTIVVPVQVTPIPGDLLRSLQFRVEVTPFTANTPAIGTNQLQLLTPTTNDFVVLHAVVNATVSGVQVYTNFNAVTNTLLGFTNSTPTNTGLAIAYIGPTNGLNLSAQAIVTAISITIPSTATNGQQYAIGVLFPSATSDGFQQNVVVKPVGVYNGYFPIQVSTNLAYVVGNSAPANWYNIGDFGNANLANADVNNTFVASFGLHLPYTGSDLFDAMDAFPLDTATTVGGDGQIRFLDWNITLFRSLRLPGFATNYKRGWNALGQRYVVSSFAFSPDLPGEKYAKTKGGPVWFRQAALVAQNLERVTPGQVVSVPVSLNVKPSYQLAGLQFLATVTPEGGAPPLSQQVAFVPAPGVPAPISFPGKLAVNQSATAWSLLGALNPAVTGGDANLGWVQFTVPTGAQSGHRYAVHFTGVDGAPDIRTQYDLESIPARVWVGTSALLPPEVISDEWKVQFFGSVDNPLAAPEANPSGNGVPNLAAYQNGLDPAPPRLHVLNSEWQNMHQGNGFKLEWFAGFGQHYVLEKATVLGQWQSLVDEVGQGQIRNFVDSNTGAQAQFYRLRRQ